MMHDGAADWSSTLKLEDTATYGALLRTFKENYYKSDQLKWKEASELWNQRQGVTERVDDFVTRVRRAARRLNIADDILHYAVLNGLRSNIRGHVLQQGVKTLKAMIEAARIAETSASADPLTALLMENIKATSQAAEKQAADLKELNAKVSALTAAAAVVPAVHATQSTFSRESDSRHPQRDFRPRPNTGRQLKDTPQRRQRDNYVRNQMQNQPNRPRPAPTTQRKCDRCGSRHDSGQCERTERSAGDLAERLCRTARTDQH
jgi:hypothetical protein